MRNIINNKHYEIDYEKLKNNVKNYPTLIVNNGDSIDLPITTTDNEKILDKYLYVINFLKNNNKIKCNGGEFKIAFDMLKFTPLDYKTWDFLLNYAKKNDIEFKVNEKVQYTYQEMRNYIEKFTITDKKGIKSFIFNGDNHSLFNNPIISTKDDVESTSDINEYGFYIDKYTKIGISSYLIKNNRSNRIILMLKPNEYVNEDIVNEIKNIVDYLKSNFKNRKIDLAFYSKCQYYNMHEFERLLEIEKYINDTYDKNYELKFHTGNELINKKQILNANNKINKVVDYLKKSKLSPYEKIIFVHKLLSEKKYYTEGDPNREKNIYFTLNSKNIVCVGYSMLLQIIFEELNDPNINVKCQFFDDRNDSNDPEIYHCLNCVYLKDDKYNIEGYYDLDITTNNGVDELNYFMIPSNDILNAGLTKHRKLMSHEQNGIMARQPLNIVKCDKEDLAPSLKHINLDIAIDNTLEFLDTQIGKTAKSKCILNNIHSQTDFILAAIKESINLTKSIPIEVTQKALQTVANKCYKLSKLNSEKYVNNIISRSLFNTLFIYDREKCENDFAKKSLEIEEGKVKLTNDKKRRKLI